MILSLHETLGTFTHSLPGQRSLECFLPVETLFPGRPDPECPTWTGIYPGTNMAINSPYGLTEMRI